MITRDLQTVIEKTLPIGEIGRSAGTQVGKEVLYSELGQIIWTFFCNSGNRLKNP